MIAKNKDERLSLALRKNLKREKLFKKKIKRKQNNVDTARYLD